jgi:uroporphyrinogen-III synthase
MNIYLLNGTKVKRAKNLLLFKLEYLQSDVDLSAYDALVFTSKNAVFAMHSFNSAWKKVPAYAIAPQTAKTIKKLGGNVKFVGIKKHGNAFAHELVQELLGKKVLYVRGKKIVSDLVCILKEGGVGCDEMIVYENVCDPEPNIQKLPKNSYIVFSSPSSIECFLKHYRWQKSYHAICIGETTAKHLPPEIKPHIADTTSIESCIDKAVELEGKKE